MVAAAAAQRYVLVPLGGRFFGRDGSVSVLDIHTTEYDKDVRIRVLSSDGFTPAIGVGCPFLGDINKN